MNTLSMINSRVQDNFDQARAHERYRTDFSKIMLTILGIMVGLLSAKEQFIDHTVVMYGVILFGVFGALVNAKHYERNRFHNAYAHYLLSLRVTDEIPIDLSMTFQEFKNHGKWEQMWLRHIRLNHLWTGFPIVVVLFVLAVSVFPNKLA